MRITTKYLNDGVPTSCENAHDAEVEDYTINVQGSLSVSEFSLSDLSIFPNPNQGEFTVKFNSPSNEQITIQVFDVRGRSIFNKAYQNTGDFNQMISLNNTQAGMYLLKINDGSKIINKKIIIK